MSIDWKAIWWATWLQKLREESMAEVAESPPAQQEWCTAHNAPTSAPAKEAVAAFIGSMRIEWRHESDHWLCIRDWRVRHRVAR